MSKKLNEIRKKIDTLDNKIHDLLMERADLVVDIAKEKKKSKMQVVQPAREAMMIRRLLARHKGPLPEPAIVRIWRELVGAVSLLQTGLKVSVSAEEGHEFCWDMAKDYFGSVLPMNKSSSSLTAISAVREDDSSFAVLPWPDEEEANPWWSYLMNQDQDGMRIVCALPHGLPKDVGHNTADKALVVSKINFQSSGKDHSFLMLEVDHTVSRARIVDALKELKFEPLSLHTKSGIDSGGHSLHMIEVDDYVPADDPRLEEIAEKFEGADARCDAMGGYPVPPTYKYYKQHTEKAPVIQEAPKEKKTGT